MSIREAQTLGWIVVALLVLALVGAVVQWIAEHWLPVLWVTALLAAGFVAYAVHRQRRRAAWELAQRSRGFERFVDRFGHVQWVPASDVSRAQDEDAAARRQESFLSQVHAAVTRFEPSLWHESELPYHMELAGWLRPQFPATAVEHQQGSSRPDIVVGRVAIEVKGPTGQRELQTIADKCARYAQHFEGPIVALYDVRVLPRMYQEWEAGIARTWPGARIVRHDPPASAGKSSFPATCAACGESTTVPFRPSRGRPVYCRSCYGERKGLA